MDIFEIKTTNGPFPLNASWRIYDRLQKTYGAAMAAIESDVQGDFADFGIAQGTSTQALAYALAHGSKAYPKQTPRMLCMFDSFKGYPELKDPADFGIQNTSQFQRTNYAKTKPSADAMADLIGSIFDKSQIVTYAGWFEDTLRDIPPERKFAVVNLDGTLYSSNFTVLSHLFQHGHFSDGCHLLIGGYLGPKNIGARKAWLDCVEKYKPEFTEVGFFGASHWHCVIHR